MFAYFVNVQILMSSEYAISELYARCCRCYRQQGIGRVTIVLLTMGIFHLKTKEAFFDSVERELGYGRLEMGRWEWDGWVGGGIIAVVIVSWERVAMQLA